MILKDLLYFSKGERRALILFVCLITAGVCILWKSENAHPSKTEQEAAKEQWTDFRQSAFPSPHPDAAPIPVNVSVPPAENLVKKATAPVPSPSRPVYRVSYPVSVKYKAGTVVELNAADTLVLKRVPGIGSVFARRIVKYRRLLGGFVSVSQLKEVYGIDESRYGKLAPWFKVDASRARRLQVNRLDADSLRRHPYINYKQARILEELRRQKGKLAGWSDIELLEEFADADKKRLSPYLSFE